MDEQILNLSNAIERARISLEPPRNYALADYQYQLIMDYIRRFESGLDDNHEVAVKLASFGQSVTLNVTKVGYSNPNLFVFYGFVGDSPATLIQHISQLSFLLLAVKKADPNAPKRKIGFALPSAE